MARFDGVAAGTVPASVSSLIAVTLPKLQKTVVDQFFDSTPFFKYLRTKGRARSWDGGDTMEIPLLFNQNPMAKAYQSYEPLDAKPPEGITTSVWALTKYRVPLLYSRSMMAANAGESAIVDLISALRDQASKSLVRKINADLWSEDTQNPIEVTSMYGMLEESTAASQTAAPGGISKSTYTWWRHNYDTCSSASAGSALGVLPKFRRLHMACSDNGETPDLAICDDFTYTNTEDILQTAVRYTNQDSPNWGFDSIGYKGVTIMHDPTLNADGANGDGDGSLFLLNTDFISLYIGSNANFKMIAPEYDKRQDCYLGVTLVDLQLVCNQMRRQGVLTGAAFKTAC